MAYEFLYKYVIVGDSAVGKSCLLYQFTHRRFNYTHELTVGVEFGSKVICCEDTKICLQVWDTAGQERFKSVARAYYRRAAAALVVYDISNRRSFENAEQWLLQCRRYGASTQAVVLVGNKADLAHSRQVSAAEGRAFAQKHQLFFVETSAKEAFGVDEAFHLAAGELTRLLKTPAAAELLEEGGVKLGALHREKERPGVCCYV